MRRFLPVIVMGLFAAFPLVAQRGGGHGGGFGGHGGGFGGHGGFRGGGGIGRGGFGGRGFGGGGYGFRGGFGGGFGHRGGFGRFGFGRHRFGFGAGIYPVFFSDFGYYDPFWGWRNSYPYSYPSSYPDYGGYAQDYGYSPAPQVIINQGYQPYTAPPAVVQEYTAPGPPPPPETQAPKKYEEPLYLVAFHDGVIRAVVAYWTQGATLHYVTMDHVQKQVPLTTVDSNLSERLNGERNVPFQLPR